MSATFFEIRQCNNCGLRYPLTEGHPFGQRCPSCLGETECVRRDPLEREAPTDGNKLPVDVRLHVLLDNIRSSWNVGSILRTSDGFGFEHVYLCGITPTPEQADVRKTALGAEEFVTWSAHRNGLEKVQELQASGWNVIALEKTKASAPIQGIVRQIGQAPNLFVLGNELTGVDPDILALSNQVVHLPMHGQKRSFNVAVAFAAATAILYYKLTGNLG